eukprot:1334729-Prymnesium_polylepis.1
MLGDAVLTRRVGVDCCASERVDGARDAAVVGRERAIDNAMIGKNLVRGIVHIVIWQLLMPDEILELGTRMAAFPADVWRADE